MTSVKLAPQGAGTESQSGPVHRRSSAIRLPLSKRVTRDFFCLLSLVTVLVCRAGILEDLGNGVNGIVGGISDAGGNAIRGLGGAAGSLLNGGVGATQQVVGGALTVVTKAGEGSLQVFVDAGGGTITALTREGQDVVVTVAQAGNNVVATYEKGWRDANEQGKRSFDDAVQAGGAMLRYQARVLSDQVNGLGNTERRIREGKVADAVWGIATEPLKSEEANFFKATQESSLVNGAAASAAAIYGGPGGAAAYAAWSTYRATGDATMAFRAGVIAGASAQFGQGAPVPENAPISEAVQRAAVAGAAGGLAVAAQGGDEAAIREGFLKSAGAVLIQTGSNRLNQYSPKPGEALQFAECISAKDVDCLSRSTYVRDAKGRLVTETSGLVSISTGAINPAMALGKWTGTDLAAVGAQGQKLIADVSKLPNSNALVLFDGQWVLTTTLSSDSDIEYGKPAVVLTSVGSRPPFAFTRTIGVGGGSSGNYQCQIGESHRSISSMRSETSCRSIYRREDGDVQVIWETPTHPEACAAKAAEFSKYLATIGVACSAR